ncbi:unnamed protein product [Heligmosomoides polygyrus]|uniref:Ig-like domain-containing protein n=1 Tax=Heligmosomoides polygyrus TaxID=6339 RepID=A0A183F7A5_HELPZ|nr:unnamed protein product [Heligmosomoides polygyrus]
MPFYPGFRSDLDVSSSTQLRTRELSRSRMTQLYESAEEGMNDRSRLREMKQRPVGVVSSTAPIPAYKRRAMEKEFSYEPPPPEVKPTFKDGDETSRSLASPAGRTVKLSCRATGYPEPRVVWHKNGAIITEASPRMTGADFKIRKGMLEMEDAAESDSGKYMCEVFNSLGTIRRTFNVTIINRMRGPPIIVPNILVNQTVSCNSLTLEQESKHVLY